MVLESIIAGLSVSVPMLYQYYQGKKTKKIIQELLGGFANTEQDFSVKLEQLSEEDRLSLLIELNVPLDEASWEFIERQAEEEGINDMTKEQLMEEERHLWSIWEDCCEAWEEKNPKWLGKDLLEGHDFRLHDLSADQIRQYWKYSFYLFTVHNEYYEKAGYDMDQYSV